MYDIARKMEQGVAHTLTITMEKDKSICPTLWERGIIGILYPITNISHKEVGGTLRAIPGIPLCYSYFLYQDSCHRVPRLGAITYGA